MDPTSFRSNFLDLQLQTTSQGLLQKAMLYHMEEGDRQNFVGVVKPTVDEAVFPNELADNLPDDLKTWLKDTYTPAYISYMLSQVDTSSETWKGDFNAEQRNKIWYWWTGQVRLSSAEDCVVECESTDGFCGITGRRLSRKVL